MKNIVTSNNLQELIGKLPNDGAFKKGIFPGSIECRESYEGYFVRNAYLMVSIEDFIYGSETKQMYVFTVRTELFGEDARNLSFMTIYYAGKRLACMCQSAPAPGTGATSLKFYAFWLKDGLVDSCALPGLSNDAYIYADLKLHFIERDGGITLPFLTYGSGVSGQGYLINQFYYNDGLVIGYKGIEVPLENNLANQIGQISTPYGHSDAQSANWESNGYDQFKYRNYTRNFFKPHTIKIDYIRDVLGGGGALGFGGKALSRRASAFENTTIGNNAPYFVARSVWLFPKTLVVANNEYPDEDKEVEFYGLKLHQEVAQITSVTASQLRTLVSNSGLTAGTFYRITDYQCTRSDYSKSQNATHQFDIVLLALSNNTLEKKGWAMLHAGDTYFANSDLSQWQVWFDLALDTYGRVLRLVDENRNDCPYDFKNVMWLHPTNNAYYYTFAVVSGNNVTDHSLNGSYCYGNTMGIGCHHIIFKNLSNTDNCNSNTFGNYCYSNTFGSSCYYNKFGNSCASNTFGNDCQNSTFGNYCFSNTFGNNCYYNKFGNNCTSNTFGNSCYSNTLGNSCYSNTLGKSCNYNTFGNNCYYNKFGNGSTIRNYYRNIIIDNGNQYIYLDCTGTLSNSSYYQNVHIGLGVNSINTMKTITDSNVNQTYQTEYLPTNSVTINV